MAAVRLRKAFRYPEDSDENEREELDEEEQERVIEQLQRQNDARNAQYYIIFTALPLLSITAFISPLWNASVLDRLCSLLGILSLLGTAYVMREFPLHPDRKGKKPLSVDDERLTLVRNSLIPVNTGLCALLGLYFFFGAGSTHWPAVYLVPGAMLGAILLAKEVMREVDLSALKDLQYDYKGA
ncbi:hypothetical protein N7488_003744 [Penicillium malachiteum]|nr:hypothetical protein N7488_003744 [Penicillium malachiteum]